jgi:hypothetical protein
MKAKERIPSRMHIDDFHTPYVHNCLVLQMYGSRDSSVGIATGYGLDDPGVGVRVQVE